MVVPVSLVWEAPSVDQAQRTECSVAGRPPGYRSVRGADKCDQLRSWCSVVSTTCAIMLESRCSVYTVKTQREECIERLRRSGL